MRLPSGWRVTVVAGTVAALVLGGCTSQSAKDGAGAFAPGRDGLGDSYYPMAGNSGYDVANYDLDVKYDPKSDTLTGSATITATATANLSRFNFDLRALTVGRVTINGIDARSAEESGDELVVTPIAGIANGTQFVVVITYGGVPEPYEEDGLGEVGFLHTADGAFAIGEPHVAAAWFPVNDHPRDKATYTIAIEAPDGLAALSNGVLKTKKSAGGWTTWRWQESSPMAPYLATMVVGGYRLKHGTHDGKPVVTAVASSLPTEVDRQMARTTDVVDFLESLFGPYPFDAIGGIVIDDERIRFALENQSRPIYSQAFFDSGKDAERVMVHELAHQWYGDSISVHDWSEIWLNEGFASYAEWLWQERQGTRTAQATFDQYFATADAPMWRVPPGNPGPQDLFHQSVYIRGAMTLHALRRTVGDEAFFTILKSWSAEKAGSTATTDEFIAVAERISGKQLDGLFTDWLYVAKRPARP